MAESSSEEVVRRYLDAHATHDFDTIGSLRHPDWTTTWPQSGERVRGHANHLAIMENWPGGAPTADASNVVGSQDRWVMTPAFTFQRIAGSGDAWWAAGTTRYSDGSTWHFAALLELRNGTVYRETWYFGPPFEAPAWRARWVERSG